MRTRAPLLVLLLLLAALAAGAFGAGRGGPATPPASAAPADGAAAFSGEDILDGAPWHHEDVTRLAAREVHFSREAERSVAWHADYVDSYLYNPLWWMDVTRKGRPARVKVSLATRDHLARLHFDDLFATEEVEDAWRRYASGTLAGLVWAAERNDVAAAHNILGVSLHAIQDFYSHSNWLDDTGRLESTWFDLSRAGRGDRTLWTGSYELAEHLGVKPHGAYAPACTVLSQPGLQELFDEGLCHAASPLSGRPICRKAEACREGEEIGLTVKGREMPENAVYLAPPGIALDNTWMARIGGRERGILDDAGAWRGGRGRSYALGETNCRAVVGDGEPCEEPADHLFARAKALATLASIQWLQLLEDAMGRAGEGGFWKRLATKGSWDRRYAQYEAYGRFPYQFLTAGPYPRGESDGYYLRVRLGTSTDRRSGTDADVRLVAGGRDTVLDYLPGEHPLLAYNDFEVGDEGVYTVGPFLRPPDHLVLHNDDADARDVLRTMRRNFRERLDSLGPRMRRRFRLAFFGAADYVGDGRRLWSAEELNGLGTSARDFTITVDGGSEGVYRLEAEIRATSPRSDDAGGSREYEVRLVDLECVEESEADRGTRQDEPFVLAALVPFGDASEGVLEGPYEDVDSGERRTIDRTFRRVRLPEGHGMLSLAVSVMESDRENEEDRRRLLDEFATAVESEAEDGERVRETIGRAVAADWKLSQIEVTAFRRGEHIEVGRVLDDPSDRWIAGGERVRFDLDLSRIRRLPVRARDLQRYPAPGVDRVRLRDALAAARERTESYLPDSLGPDIPGPELPREGGAEPIPLSHRRGLGFAWAERRDAERYAPSDAYSYNGAGGAIRVERRSAGRYQVLFVDLASGGRGGHVQVAAYGGARRRCQVERLGTFGSTFRANVLCTDLEGRPADARFVIQALAPGTRDEGLGYAWADRPRAGRYAPSEPHAFNGAGGAVRVRRTATGRYGVRFEGLGGTGARPGGHVQVTAYGETALRCKVVRWSSAGEDLDAEVACFGPDGRRRDGRFLVQAWGPGAGLSWTGYAWAQRPAAAGPYRPNPTYARNGSGEPIRAERTGRGRYRVTFEGLGGGESVGGSVQVTGYGDGPATCQVVGWAARGEDLAANVSCHGPDGRPADTRFAIQALGVAAGSPGFRMPGPEPRAPVPTPTPPLPRPDTILP